jgi:hypothetical protein
MSETRPSGPDISALQAGGEQGLESTAASGGGYSIQVSTTDSGFAIQYTSPSGHNPNTDWDWIGVYSGNSVPPYADLGDYVTWNWVCPNRSCSNTGTAVVNFDWQAGTTYTLVYFLWKWTVVANQSITTP